MVLKQGDRLGSIEILSLLGSGGMGNVYLAKDLKLGRTLALRATSSLSRLLGKLGRKQEAREILAEIYGWFTEGFDTDDLKNAKSLLDSLSD